MTVLEQHIRCPGGATPVSSERNNPHNALQYLVRHEGVILQPPQDFHSGKSDGDGWEHLSEID